MSKYLCCISELSISKAETPGKAKLGIQCYLYSEKLREMLWRAPRHLRLSGRLLYPSLVSLPQLTRAQAKSSQLYLLFKVKVKSVDVSHSFKTLFQCFYFILCNFGTSNNILAVQAYLEYTFYKAQRNELFSSIVQSSSPSQTAQKSNLETPFED